MRSFHLGVNAQNFGKDSLPGFQIYVRLDLLDGELNDKNISGIKCKFEDLSLTGKFNKLFYNKPYIWKPDMNPYIKSKSQKNKSFQRKLLPKLEVAKRVKKNIISDDVRPIQNKDDLLFIEIMLSVFEITYFYTYFSSSSKSYITPFWSSVV